jgi:hypothetical protein
VPTRLRVGGETGKIEPGFPHEFLQQELIRNIIYASTYDQFDNHHRR